MGKCSLQALVLEDVYFITCDLKHDCKYFKFLNSLLISLWLAFFQVDPKFLRNLRFSKKHNKGHGGKAVKMES